MHAKTLLRQTMQKTIDFKVKYLCQDIDTDDKKQTISSDSACKHSMSHIANYLPGAQPNHPMSHETSRSRHPL